MKSDFGACTPEERGRGITKILRNAFVRLYHRQEFDRANDEKVIGLPSQRGIPVYERQW